MSKLTVIVAAYNVEEYIEKCLISLVQQTYRELEILVVNDGSTDNTKKLIENFEEKYKNLKLLNKENGGLSSARNFGLKNIKTEYVTFVDGDDYLELNAYEVVMKKIEEEKTELGIFNFKKVYPQKINNSKLNENIYKSNFLEYLFSKSKEEDIVVWNKIFKADIILKNKIYFENRAYFEDTGFIFRYLYFVKNISLIELPLYNYVQRKNSITKKFNPVIITSCENTYKVVKEFYKKNNEYEKYKDKIEDMYLRMRIYTLNNSLKYRGNYHFKITWQEINNTKIPLKHKIVLIIFKMRIYKKVYLLLK
ncbi:glycosyltransferase family 2 protein [Fusobacterium sp.]|uniref:glycosyltransferase family 2 protein n=1 Tax=Fusobacterium sp. TaxID=68766 RepID=UPI002E78BE6F|nr:glycosyltransferase [Fusobacterium sp.]MEE1476686.1 glycosyltransferase [Fusobacterium sp.]